MTVEQLHKRLVALGACGGARNWVAAFTGTPAEAWEACERPDWLFWLASESGVDSRLSILAACDCAEPVLIYAPDEVFRPSSAIEAARNWAAGLADRTWVLSCAYSAYNYAYSHYGYNTPSYHAGLSAYHAAYAACYPRNSRHAYDAARCAALAASLAGSADYDDALRASCAIIRRHIPAEVILAALEVTS